MNIVYPDLDTTISDDELEELFGHLPELLNDLQTLVTDDFSNA